MYVWYVHVVCNNVQYIYIIYVTIFSILKIINIFQLSAQQLHKRPFFSVPERAPI